MLTIVVLAANAHARWNVRGEKNTAPFVHPEFSQSTHSTIASSTPIPGPLAPTAIATNPSTRPSVRFAVLGDFGNDSTAEGDVAKMIDDQNVDFIATVGDNRYGSRTFDEAVGRYFCGYLNNVTRGAHCSGGDSPVNAFFPSPGNHDYNDGGGINEYLDYFALPGSGVETSNTSGVERYYDVIHGPVHLFLLDSDSADSSASDRDIQQTWLKTQLAASAAP